MEILTEELTSRRTIEAGKKSSCLELYGAEWALDSSMREIAFACRISSKDNTTLQEDTFSPLTDLKLKDFDLNTTVAANIIQLFQKHSSSLQDLTLYECSGHIDLVLTVALTALPNLQTLRIATGRLSTAAFDPCANALGVALQGNQSLQQLTLQSGSNVFFTLSTEAARSLADGLAKNCRIEQFDLIGCRFADTSTLSVLAGGLRKYSLLKQVKIHSCFQSNGHALDDSSLAKLILALGQHNRQLEGLDLTGNQCLSVGIAALSTLLDRTKLRKLNLSCQCILTTDDGHHGRQDNYSTANLEGENSSHTFLNLSLLVAALGRNNTLQELELKFNQLSDSDMAYLAAGLTHNTSIRYLGLASNRIANLGLSILASRIPNMKGLKHLVLTNNQYDSKGLEEMACAMKDNVHLESVDLDSCCLSSKEIQGTTPPWKTIRFYADLNWSGRRYLDRQNLPQSLSPGLWALVLSRTSQVLFEKSDGKERQADVLFTLLRLGGILFSM